MITGDNNIVGNNNSVNTTTTNTSATNGTATGTTDARSSTSTGSSDSNLRQALRSGSEATITSSSGERATFTPPTGRMGNGEVDRALTLANRDLAAAGITNPTPQQTEAALMGGSVTNARGESADMSGVLQLRSQGMGWGQIAHSIDVHPSQSAKGESRSMRGRNHGPAAAVATGAPASGDRFGGAAAATQSGTSNDRFGGVQPNPRSGETGRSAIARSDSRATAASDGRTSISSRDQAQARSSALASVGERDNRPGHASGRTDDRSKDRESVTGRSNGGDGGKHGKR